MTTSLNDIILEVQEAEIFALEREKLAKKELALAIQNYEKKMNDILSLKNGIKNAKGLIAQLNK